LPADRKLGGDPARHRTRTSAPLLAGHELSGADSLQLAAALIWAGDSPAGRTFVCLDNKLRAAAQREGFLILPEV
jgi:hypothetical protein